MNYRNYIYIVLTVISLILIILFFPVKYAIKREELVDNRNFIIIKVQKATVSQWIAIGDQNTLYDIPVNVRIVGKEPTNFNYDIESGDNTFVCYGKYADSVDMGGGDKYSIFESSDWDILYPIKRNSLFSSVLPKSYICVFDTIN